jgi:hypothetical protein
LQNSPGRERDIANFKIAQLKSTSGLQALENLEIKFPDVCMSFANVPNIWAFQPGFHIGFDSAGGYFEYIW